MVIKDIYSADFLACFGKSRDKIAQIKQADAEIDLNSILKVLNITKQESVMFERADIDNRKIMYNILQPTSRQKFVLARGIGQIVLNTDDIRVSQQFAIELLLPEKLIIRLMKDYNNSLKDLQKINVNKLIAYLAKKTNLSSESIKYRLLNLGIIEY